MNAWCEECLAVAAIAIVACVSPVQAQAPSVETLLADSIALHDPEGVWATGAFRLAFDESRPDGTIRNTTVVIDNAAGRFAIDSERGGRSIQGELGPEVCLWSLDGSTEFSNEDRDELRLTCDRLEWLRNYYVYLWGMPMKLRDPGTLLDPEAKESSFQSRPALEVRVTYEEAVGSDVWYFYFDPESRALIGYRFYHDEAANDGEYITLEGLQEGAGLRLPGKRAWYMHQADEYLGTDELVAVEAVVGE